MRKVAVGEAGRVGRDAVDPDFSPDGKRIAFLRDNRVGHAAASNGRDEKLLPEEIDAYEVVWSPDGRYFLIAANAISRRHHQCVRHRHDRGCLPVLTRHRPAVLLRDLAAAPGQARQVNTSTPNY